MKNITTLAALLLSSFIVPSVYAIETKQNDCVAVQFVNAWNWTPEVTYNDCTKGIQQGPLKPYNITLSVKKGSQLIIDTPSAYMKYSHIVIHNIGGNLKIVCGGDKSGAWCQQLALYSELCSNIELGFLDTKKGFLRATLLNTRGE